RRKEMIQTAFGGLVIGALIGMTSMFATNESGKSSRRVVYHRTTQSSTPTTIPANSEFGDIIAAASRRFKVHQELLHVILKRESAYCRNIGTPGIPARLRSQARLHHNIKNFNKICEDCGFDPDTVRGSSTGAMGCTQFQPTTWVQFSMDGDGDGKKCPDSVPDSIFTQAHYLSKLAERFDEYQKNNFRNLESHDRRLPEVMENGLVTNKWDYAILRYAGVYCDKNFRYVQGAKRDIRSLLASQ
ncbi:lytic murein transglycosylase, partial [Patescibacteria group bacterium]